MRDRDLLFKYLIWRILTSWPGSSLSALIAAVLAPLLSIVTLSGRPCCRTAFLKKCRADFLSRRACELTTPEVGDPTAVQDLLNQITTPFDTFMGDGAYDGEPVSRTVLDQQPDAQGVIPPHKNAICSDAGDTQRDQHIQAIEQHGWIV